MKRGSFIFFILIIIFIPAISGAMPVPTSNLSVTVNTEGQDAVFNFELTNFPQFSLETQSLSATTSGSIAQLFAGVQYALSQDNVSGLKLDNIFCTSDNPGDVFLYQTNSVTITPWPQSNISCTFNNVKVKTPVLIVPGLMGTEMKNGSELLWANLVRMLPDISDSFLDPLAFNKDLSPIDNGVYDNDVIRKEPFFDYTDGLINEFKNQGYIEDENLFTFPYDWRYGVSGKYSDGTTNADLLKNKIDDILQKTGASNVNIVAHSEGGLIVKKYVVDHPVDHHIGKAVFVGVPNTGAPKAIKILLEGDSLGIPWLSQDEIKKIAGNLPVSYDLSPSHKYYDEKGSFVETVDEGNVYDLSNSFPEVKIKDLNYDESKSFLTTDHNLNSEAFTGAEDLHTQDFDNFDLRQAGVDIYAIDGCKTATIGKIIERRYVNIFGSNITEYETPKFIPGDNTVPLESATNLPINDGNKFYLLSADHSKMLSQDGSRQEIVNLLSGSNLNVNDKFITQDISRCNLNGKAISVFSPVNIFVTDQSGNRLGLADDGSVINEIPGADFEIFNSGGVSDAHKFIFLPTDDGQVYTINLTGAGQGTFTIKSQDIQNNQVAKTEVFSNLPATLELKGSILINPVEGSSSLNIKQTSAADQQTILPDATLTSAVLEDYSPPTSLATLTGEKDAQGDYTGQVQIEIKSTDSNSGVLAVQYNLDDAGTQKIAGNLASLTVSTEGKHSLTFFATDKAGNNEPEKKIEFSVKIAVPAMAVGGGSILIQTLNESVSTVENKNLPIVLENPKPVDKKIVKNKIKKIVVKNLGAVPAQESQPKNNVAVMGKQNPFMASLGSFSGWFSNLWHKVINTRWHF